MSANKGFVKLDADTDETPGVNHWPESNPSGSSSLDSVRRSSSAFRPKGLTSTSTVGGRATQADVRFVPTTPTRGAEGW